MAEFKISRIRYTWRNAWSNTTAYNRDDEDRTIEILGETDWQIQLDDSLPTSLSQRIFIPRHMWHRTIKGTGPLKIKIYKS